MSNSAGRVHFLPSLGDPGHEDCGCDSRVRADGMSCPLVALGDVAKMWRARRSGRLTLLLVLHPLADEIRASDDAEISTLAAYQIHKRNPVQLLQMR
jgi:hypothetical protein